MGIGWCEKYARGYRFSFGCRGVVATKELVADDPEIIKRDVGELRTPIDVANGPDIRNISFQSVIHGNEAFFVQLYSRGVYVQSLQIGLSAGGDEHGRDFNFF